MDLVAMLPWWAGVAAARVSYFVLRGLSVGPAPASLQPGLSGLQCVDAAADGAEGKPRGLAVLGLLPVSGVSWDPVGMALVWSRR